MGDEDRLLADLDRIERRLIAGVRDVDRDAELVHPADRLPAELSEPTVARLAQPAAERVRFAVRDAR